MLISFKGHNQFLNEDSLINVWGNTSLDGLVRAEALYKFANQIYQSDEPIVEEVFDYLSTLIKFAEKQNLNSIIAKSYILKGDLHYSQGDTDQTITEYENALTYSSYIEDSSTLSSIYLVLGSSYSTLSNWEKTFENYDKAIKIQKIQNNKNGLAASYNNIANAYTYRGDFQKAIDYLTKSLKMYDELGDNYSKVVAISNVGNINYIQGEYEVAMEYYKESQKIATLFNIEEQVLTSNNNIGNTYHMLNQSDSAIYYFNQSLKVLERFPNPYDKALTLNNLGNVFTDIGKLEIKKKVKLSEITKFQEAIDYHKKSYSIQKEIRDIDGMSYSLGSIAEIYFLLNQIQKAIEYGEKALTLAKESNSVVETKYSADFLYRAYKKNGKSSKALEMYELYIDMKDSIVNEENQKEIMRQRFQYDYEKKSFQDSLKAAQEREIIQTELKLSDVKLQKEKTLRYSLIFGVIMLLFFGLFVFNRFKVTQKKNKIIEQQKHLVEEKNKEILDSITYAKRLQDAILPPAKLVSAYLLESFIIYKPKDIVAGDFYFMDVVEEKNKKLVYYVAADCTGHGVPGAMVSIVGANGLKRCIQEFGLRDPGEILDQLAQIVAENFSQSEEKIRDGMDLALCCLEMKNEKAVKVHYAGANNPLWVINPNRKELPENAIPFKQGGGFEIKANKQAIGYTENIAPFDSHTIDVEEGDTLYTFSDGYPDQFGGEAGKKYKSANFKKLLLSIYDKNMDEQKKLINKEFEDWKGELEQLDDVCVIGVRL